MAERYRGPHSPLPRHPGEAPGGPPPPPGPFQGARRSKAGGRVNLLFFAPLPFLLTAFRAEPVGLALDLGAFGLLILAAWLTREGILAQEAYEARSVARRPAIPRKLFAAALTGAGLFLGGLVPGGALLEPAIFAVLGTVLHVLAFGPDPLRDKGLEGVDAHQAARVARAVEGAERTLAQMRDAAARLRDRGLEARIDRFQAAARAMFRAVESDPRDLSAARRYLGVYLEGARDATVKFADLWAATRDRKARADYEALLDDLEAGFVRLTETLRKDDRSALDIEIAVLRERLRREGLSPTE
jgi:hypothetical protein